VLCPIREESSAENIDHINNIVVINKDFIISRGTTIYFKRNHRYDGVNFQIYYKIRNQVRNVTARINSNENFILSQEERLRNKKQTPSTK
jgi:hypothetical protein